MPATPELRLYTFGPADGLPTTGPFGLKLELALRIAGVPYTRVVENDARKGPKRKSPWIEQGDVRMGDTTLILRHLGVDLDAHLGPQERAVALAWRVLAEEHWHQVLEYELFVHPDGYAAMDAWIARAVPAPVVPLAGWWVRRSFRLHLVERGMGRHDAAEIEQFGRQDLDAFASWLAGREWAVGDRPSTLDCTFFGLLGPALWTSFPTPCFRYARTLAPLMTYAERIRARWFPEIPEAAQPS